MSASGPEMDREFSAHSLLSRAGSERNSQDRVEMGIYVSSFAATIFIAGLVTVGVSLITLLVALTVMLQTCQTQSTGVLEKQMTKTNDYEYCKILTLHLELNHLESNALPAVCDGYTNQYVAEGHYARDLNVTLELIEGYFNSINPGQDGQDAVVMDADDFFSPEFRFTRQPLKQSRRFGCHDCGIDAISLKQHSVLEMYTKLRAGGWSMILLSRRPDRLRHKMVQELISAGYGGWSSLIMRMDNQTQIDCKEHIFRNDSMIQKQDYQIVAAISSQWDFLTGSCRGIRNFRLPNLIVSQKIEDNKAQE